jgi:hypothetical protein
MKEQLIFGGVGFGLAIAVVVLLLIVVKLVRRFRRGRKKPVESGAFFLPEPQPVQPQTPQLANVPLNVQTVEKEKKILLNDFIKDMELNLRGNRAELDVDIEYDRHDEPRVCNALVKVVIEKDDKPKTKKRKK